jgi:predicted SAM-dependent methyltransferase
MEQRFKYDIDRFGYKFGDTTRNKPVFNNTRLVVDTPVILSGSFGKYVTQEMKNRDAQTPQNYFHAPRLSFTLEFLSKIDGLPETPEVLILGNKSFMEELIIDKFPDWNIDFSRWNLRFPVRGKFTAKRYDLIIGTEVLEHLHDIGNDHQIKYDGIKNCLSSLHFLLKPDGQFFYTTPNGNSFANIQRKINHNVGMMYPHHFREYTPTEIKRLIEQCGLTHKSFNTYDVWAWTNKPDTDKLKTFMNKNHYDMSERGDNMFGLVVRK